MAIDILPKRLEGCFHIAILLIYLEYVISQLDCREIILPEGENRYKRESYARYQKVPVTNFTKQGPEMMKVTLIHNLKYRGFYVFYFLISVP